MNIPCLQTVSRGTYCGGRKKLENIKNNEVKKINTKRLRMELLLGLILIVFLAYKFSVARYMGFVTGTDARQFIEDFERHYLYTKSLQAADYLKVKTEILAGAYTTKEKLGELVDAAKTDAGDTTSVFSYADIMKGKISYSIFEQFKFESRTIDGNKAYIKLNTFGEKSSERFIKAVKKMKNMDYLILDLRDNDKGDYSQAIDIADYLLPENAEICSLEFAHSKHSYNSDGYCMSFKKIFVLLNEKSGYCSEMVALALKNGLGDNVEFIGNTTEHKNIGEFYNSYYNKMDLSAATLKWYVNGKNSDALDSYLSKYSGAELENLDDYLKIIDSSI